jgi:hypothetical protein
MPVRSPARAGFDAVIRRPALVLAEIAWRWGFGLASLALMALTCGLFLASIRVSDADLQLARTGSPWIAADVMARLIAANKAPLLRGFAVLVPGIAILWTVAAAVGRMITTPPLVASPPPRASASFGALLGISFLRAALMLALIAGYFGCALIAAEVSNMAGGAPGAVVQAFLLVFLPLFLLVMLAWGALNWLFSIAPVFAVRDGRSTFASFSDCVRLFSANKRDFIAIGSAYGLAKSIAIVIVTLVGLALVPALSGVPALLTAVLIAITLAYFAFADLLNLARLASYAVLAEVPATEPAGHVTSV